MSTQVDLFTNVEPSSVSPAIAKPIVVGSASRQKIKLLGGVIKPKHNNMSGDVKFEGTQEEWDALVKKNNEDAFLERLINEEKELGEKIVALNKALNSDGFAVKVGLFQFELLNLQHGAMLTYRRVLIMRINDLKNAQALRDALADQKA